MADPVSWLLIEPGWRVVASDGQEVGRVEEVTGDSGADIFDGLAISSSAFAHPRYVPSETVGQITEGQVQLSLDTAAIEALAKYDEPAESAHIDPEGASHVQRAEASVVHPKVQAHPTSLVHRVLEWFGLAGKR